MSLPSADDLFRPTAEPAQPAAPDAERARGRAVRAVAAPSEPGGAPSGERGGEHGGEQEAAGKAAPRKPSGRVRHDEKMTVYITSDELLEIEHARLSLRRNHGLAVDRGRLVREAVAMVLAEFEAHGAQSALVRRLSEE